MGMQAYVEHLRQSRIEGDFGDSDSIVVHVGDVYHKGTDIYWSDRLNKWVFVSFEDEHVEFADTVVVFESAEDGDETGLNSCYPLGIDLDGPKGIWVVGFDEFEEKDADMDCQRVRYTVIEATQEA